MRAVVAVLALGATLGASLGLAVPALAATPAEAVARMLSSHEGERARRRCDKLEARALGADPALREICAEAYWPLVAAADTLEQWARFQRDWAGTSRVSEAREEEAGAAFRGVDRDDQAALMALAERYPGTSVAGSARELAAYMAFNKVYTPAEALEVAREFPEHPDTPALMERFPAAFVRPEISDTQVNAAMVPPFHAPAGRALSARWVARQPDQALVPWDQRAAAQLEAQGLSPSRLRTGDDHRGFPLCYDPLSPEGTHPGVEVRLGAGSAFFEVPFEEACGPGAWPVFLTVVDGRVTSLSPTPDLVLSLPTRAAPQGFAWGAASTLTGVYVACEPGVPLVVPGARVIGQPCGERFLVHPLAGGLPWLTDMSPPRSAVALGGRIGTAVVPRTWATQPTDGGGTRVYGPASGGGEWALPPGEVRNLTPLAHTLLGLGPPSEPLEVSSPLPAPADSFWQRDGVDLAAGTPTGASPLELVATSELAAVSAGLDGATVTRGWTAQLDDDAPLERVALARAEGVDLLVVVDTYATGRTRYFALVEPLARGEPEVFAFTWQGWAYVALAGRIRGTSRVVAVHFDDRGLVREQHKVGR